MHDLRHDQPTESSRAAAGLGLAKYDAAKAALAAAVKIDEVKDIHDKAAALIAYARQAKDEALINHATEIKLRAERRLGEVMAEQRAAGKLKTGGKAVAGIIGSKTDPMSLSKRGVDKHLADRARKAAALPVEKFEAEITERCALAVAIVENDKKTVAKAREREVERKQAERKAKHEKVSAAALQSLGGRRFPLILADPPWRFPVYSDRAGRMVEQHYPTLTDDEIINFRVDGREIADIAHKDAALFLWCTSSNLDLALEVMKAWGFNFSSSAVWVKDKIGLGYIFRNQHEILLYGKRGKMPAPQFQPSSVFSYPRMEHSAKPPEIRQAIERMYPDFDKNTRLELFARGAIEGWSVYGNEAETIA